MPRLMTVSNLIEQLQRFDPSWPILCQDDLALRSPTLVTGGTERMFVDSPEDAESTELHDVPVVMIF